MVVKTSQTSNHDEKLMALASHASIAIFFIGPLTLIIPLMIWLLENNKAKPSKFVQFHAKQAFFYQLAVYVAALILLIIIAILTLIWIGKLLSPFYGLAWIVCIIYGVYGAWQVWKGNAFRYIFIADFIEAGEK